MTFRDLDGQDELVIPTRSSLDEWYDKVRDTPIADLSIDDLCRSCRQKLHLDHVLPVVFVHLRNDPTSGAIFDGELASVTARIPATFWREKETYARTAREILQSVLPTVDEDIREEIGVFLALK